MNAQQFNQHHTIGSLFYFRVMSGNKVVRTVGPAKDCSDTQAMVEINRNPWFVPIQALNAARDN